MKLGAEVLCRLSLSVNSSWVVCRLTVTILLRSPHSCSLTSASRQVPEIRVFLYPFFSTQHHTAFTSKLRKREWGCLRSCQAAWAEGKILLLQPVTSVFCVSPQLRRPHPQPLKPQASGPGQPIARALSHTPQWLSTRAELKLLGLEGTGPVPSWAPPPPREPPAGAARPLSASDWLPTSTSRNGRSRMQLGVLLIIIANHPHCP